jgi:hypothetical protein
MLMQANNIKNPADYWRLREQGEMLRYEAFRLDQILSIYGDHTRKEPRNPALAPLDHHDMLESSSCGCNVCFEWRGRQEDFASALRMLPVKHKWSTCNCSSCRFIGRAHWNLLAAANTRDLLIEMAFYGRHHSRHPNHVMAWFNVEMRRPEYTINWRAREMGQYPTARWLRRCQEVVGPLISGAVFHGLDIEWGPTVRPRAP